MGGGGVFMYTKCKTNQFDKTLTGQNTKFIHSPWKCQLMILYSHIAWIWYQAYKNYDASWSTRFDFLFSNNQEVLGLPDESRLFQFCSRIFLRSFFWKQLLVCGDILNREKFSRDTNYRHHQYATSNSV